MISKSFAFAHPTVEARELVDDASMIYHSCVASIHSTDVRESQARGLSLGLPDSSTSSYTMPLVFLFDDSVGKGSRTVCVCCMCCFVLLNRHWGFAGQGLMPEVTGSTFDDARNDPFDGL